MIGDYDDYIMIRYIMMIASFVTRMQGKMMQDSCLCFLFLSLPQYS